MFRESCEKKLRVADVCDSLFLTKRKKREKKTWTCEFLLLSQFCMNLKNCPVAVDEDEGEGSLRLLEIPTCSSDGTNGNR